MFSVTACKQDNELKKWQGKMISIEKFQNKKISTSDIALNMEVLRLNSNAALIGQIKDICIIDTIVYILDGVTSSIFAYNLQNGQLLNNICRVGNGPMEYIQPFAITAGEQQVWVLDLPTTRVIAFDKNLNPVKEIKIPFVASDFIKIEDGFLFCNLTPNERINVFVHADMEGNILNSFVTSQKQGSYTGGSSFIRDVNNEVYAMEPYSNKIYHWTGCDFEDFFQTDFLNFNIPNKITHPMSYYEDHHAYNANFFVTSTHFINSFLYKSNRYYHFFNLSSKKYQVGEINNDENLIPFFPRWQHNDYLIGVCQVENLLSEKDKTEQDLEQEALVFFSVNH